MLVLGLFFGGKVQAASITVSTDAHPSACTLDEAIQNMNNQTQTNSDCVETGAYGTDDSITIPSGTVTLGTDLPTINGSSALTIEGQGMGQTMIDGTGFFRAISHMADTDFTIKKLKITGYYDYAVNSEGGDVTVDQVEVDGSGAAFSGTPLGIFLQNSTTNSRTMRVTNSYIHDIHATNGSLQTLIIVTKGSATNTAYIENVTVAHISNTNVTTGIAIGTGFTGGGSGGMNATVRNVTITDIHATAGPGSGITSLSFGGDTNVTQLAVENSTLTDFSGADRGLGYTNAGIGSATVAPNSGQQPRSDVTVMNSVIDGQCATIDIGQLVIGSGAGTGVQSLTSLGGNLSTHQTNNSCSSYFTHPTDQNNVSALADTLGSLSDNGGYVPTIPLLQGSPAIDAGVTVPGLTTDARLASRPQGTAYDSGAYESPYSKAEETGESLAGTGQGITPILMLALIATFIGFSSAIWRTRASSYQ